MVWHLAGGLVLAAWVFLLLGRGGFWRLRESPGVAKPAGQTDWPSVVAVVPARNEARVVSVAIASLAAQEYSGPFRIVLTDDSSEDGTAEVARAVAPASVLTVVAGAPLPAGWTGKLWALAQGVREAARFPGEYLLLTDADISHSKTSLAGLVGRAEAGGYDAVSYMATLECRSWAERAIVPAFVFFFFLLYPPAWIADPRRKTAGAAGGCILLRRSALARIGGIESIRRELIDDCALASAVKRTGGKIWLGPSHAARSLRRYDSLAECGRMISRSAFTQLGYSSWALAGTIAGMSALFLLPPWMAAAGPAGLPRLLGASAWVAMCAAYYPAVRYYRRSPLWAPALPLVAAFYMGATVHSAVHYWRGKGGMWKGRPQAAR